MSSPFATYEEFEGAIDGPTGGAIYTFAHNPTVNIIALLIGVGLFIWFLARTFKSHYDTPIPDQALTHLSSFIVAGLLSLAGVMESRQPMRPSQPAAAQAEVVSQRSRTTAALGLLGLVGIGLPARQQGSKAGSRGRSHRRGRYRDIQSPR